MVCHLLANSGKMGFGDLRTVSISFSPGGILVLTQLRQIPSVGISLPLGREIDKDLLSQLAPGHCYFYPLTPQQTVLIRTSQPDPLA